MASKLDILIDVKAKAAELTNLRDEMGRFVAQTKAATVAGHGLSAAIAGFAGGLAAGAVTAFTSALAAIPASFINATKEGIRFNATLQDSQLGVAAILRQFAPEEYRTLGAAMGEAGQAIELLKEKAKTSPASFSQLVSAFQGVSGAATAAGIPIRQQVDLIVQMSQALAGLGIRNEQILQESRALLTGNITEDAMAARILGITKADIDTAKQSGQLYEFLSGKMAAFGEAGAAGAKNFTTASSNLQDAIEQLAGEASKPLFDILTQSILDLQELVADGSFRSAMLSTGQDIASLSQVIAGGAKALVSELPLLINVGKALAAAGFVLSSQILLGVIQKLLLSLRALPAALGPVGIAVAAASAAYVAFNAVLDASLAKQRAQVEQAKKFNSELTDLMQTIRQADTEAAQRTAKIKIETELANKTVQYFEGRAKGMSTQELAQMKLEMDALQDAVRTFDINKGISPKEAPKPKIDINAFEADLQKKQFEALPPNDQLGRLEAERNAALAPAREALGMNETATLEQLIAKYKELAQVKRTISLEAAIPTEALQSQVNSLRVQKAEVSAALAEAESADKRALLLGDRKALQDSQTITIRSRLTLLTDELAKAQNRLSETQERNKLAAQGAAQATSESGVAVGRLAEALQPAIAAEEKLNTWLEANSRKASEVPEMRIAPTGEKTVANQEASLDIPNNFEQPGSFVPDPTWDSLWQDYFKRIEDLGAQAATYVQDNLQSAINGVSGAITQAIMGTKSWGAAFAQAGQQILQTLIQTGIELALHNILRVAGQTIMQTGATLGAAIRTSDTAATVAAETTKAAAATPAALLTSVSSYGVAAAVGLAAIIAAIAAFGGFAEGGYTGSGGKYEPAGIVHRGEYVFSAQQTNRIGAAYLERLANAPTGIRAGYAEGGLVGGGAVDAMQPGGGVTKVNVEAPKVTVGVVNSRAELRRWAESAEGARYLGEMIDGKLRTRAL